jgi:hypothetical protein
MAEAASVAVDGIGRVTTISSAPAARTPSMPHNARAGHSPFRTPLPPHLQATAMSVD